MKMTMVISGLKELNLIDVFVFVYAAANISVFLVHPLYPISSLKKINKNISDHVIISWENCF